MKNGFFGLVILIVSVVGSSPAQSGFLVEQSRYPRVRSAIEEKNAGMESRLRGHGLDKDHFHLVMIAYKAEGILELHVKNKDGERYQKLTEYRVCARSRQLGPKRRQGDRQVPEGFYYIDRFNPSSNYHLSLGIDYPNRSDRIKSTHDNLGGDIFIHGSCVTIGCLPMTDDKIKEIYLYAVYARNNGQDRIPVYIFPFRMEQRQADAYTGRYRGNVELTEFWKNLQAGYTLWKNAGKELSFTIDSQGDYRFGNE